MSTFAKVNGRPAGSTGSASDIYFETTGQMVVRASTSSECIVSTVTTKEWTVNMAATAFIAAIGGTVTP